MKGDKVAPGQPMKIPAEQYNAFVDAADRNVSRPVLSPIPQMPINHPVPTVLVQNITETDAPRFGILAVGDPLVLPEDDLTEFQNTLGFFGVEPDTSNADNFIILTEPIAAGEFGRGVVTGTSLVHIDVSNESHTHATTKSSNAGIMSLKSAESGLVRIIWREGGTGNQWAIVAFGGVGGGGASASRWARVMSLVGQTPFIVVQEVDYVTAAPTEDEPNPDTVFMNVGDPEVVPVWPHLQGEDFEQFISSNPTTFISLPIIELKFMSGDWYASQTTRFRIKPKRPDLIKGTC